MTIAERTSISRRLEAILQRVQEINQLVKSGTPADIAIAREKFSRPLCACGLRFTTSAEFTNRFV